MKKVLLYLSVLFTLPVMAQDKLPIILLPGNLTLHFVSPENIQYVDISTKDIIGDLPLKNVLRLRLKDSTHTFSSAVLTIAGEKFLAQFRLLPGTPDQPTEISVMPNETHPLDISGIGFSQNQLKILSMHIFSEGTKHPAATVKAFGLKGSLNHIYSAGDYIFLDVSFHNKTNLNYDIDDIRFSIDDKKVVKAANSQSVALKPVFDLFPVPSFSRSYRNIFVLKKLSFPGNKILRLELSEKQISGRVISLRISYQDILRADTLPD